MKTTTLEPVPSEVQATNERLARLCDVAKADLIHGADLRSRDTAVFCGIVGGKDVGKSTLINAMVGADISLDRQAVGEGTRAPVVYFHEGDRPVVEGRLAPMLRTLGIDALHCPHTSAGGERLVLVDLPDIDSTFEDHLTTVQCLVDALDRVIWMLDPKKADDRSTAELVARVVRDPENVYVVLNKLDLLLKDGLPKNDADAFWTDHEAWLGDIAEALGVSETTLHLRMVAAGAPTAPKFRASIERQWGQTINPDDAVGTAVSAIARRAESEFLALRGDILRTCNEAEAQRIKQANVSAEIQANAERLAEHYQLRDRIAALRSLLAELRSSFKRHLGEGDGYASTVSQRLEANAQTDGELASRIIEERVGAWPLLAMIYFPLKHSRIFALLSRLARVAETGERFVRLPQADLFRVKGRGLQDRVGSVVARVESQAATLGITPARLGDDSWANANEVEAPLDQRLARTAAAGLGDLAEQVDRSVVDMQVQRPVRFRVLGNSVLAFIPIWFLLIQPIGEGLLELAASRQLGEGMHASYTIVRALGAGSLLKGLAAVTGILIVLVLGMHGRTVSQVRRVRRGSRVGRRRNSASALELGVREELRQSIYLTLETPYRNRLKELEREDEVIREWRDGEGSQKTNSPSGS